MNTNKEVEWRRFIVPKKLNKLMTTPLIECEIEYAVGLYVQGFGLVLVNYSHRQLYMI